MRTVQYTRHKAASLCITTLLQDQHTVEIFIIIMETWADQMWAMDDEGYMGYVINRPIDEIWNTKLGKYEDKLLEEQDKKAWEKHLEA